jgi:3'-phosphoadenosine 5'-phosphosulfate sulfotransferase (PAPS reductase)/FAD synthetase
MNKGSTIAVWFSCGAASAVAAKVTLAKYPDCTIRVINTPILEEDADNRRFLADVQDWLGVEIETAINPKWPAGSVDELWEARGYMSGPGGAICTAELKKKARQIWERENHHDWLVLGFTAEEKHRHDMFALGERENILPVLIEEGLTKADCFQIIQAAGIELPRMYRLGYPNANCIGCVKATSPTYWNHVRKMHPDIFQRRAELSRQLGVRLTRYKGKRIFLDELPETASGGRMKDISWECGIFCQEP